MRLSTLRTPRVSTLRLTAVQPARSAAAALATHQFRGRGLRGRAWSKRSPQSLNELFNRVRITAYRQANVPGPVQQTASHDRDPVAAQQTVGDLGVATKRRHAWKQEWPTPWPHGGQPHIDQGRGQLVAPLLKLDGHVAQPVLRAA